MEKVVRVPPSRTKSVWAVVHDMPDDEDCRNMEHLSGAVGRLFWPLLHAMTGLSRWDVYVTSVFKSPVDSPTPEQLEEAARELRSELEAAGCLYVLSLGHLAGAVLLGEQWSKVEVHNGLTYVRDSLLVTPTWHPAAALRPAETSKDPLAWLGAGLCHWKPFNRIWAPEPISVPKVSTGHTIPPEVFEIAVDTEGTPDSPECVTWAHTHGRFMVEQGWIQNFFKSVREFCDRGGVVWFHNAPWDWQVLRSLGSSTAHNWRFRDTMELAYLLQTEPQGLKDLSERHLGLRMKSWEDVVMSHWNEYVRLRADEIIENGTTVTTHSPKTGKEYKKPKVQRTELASKLHKMKDLKRIAKLVGVTDPNFTFVPHEQFHDYATLDPFATLHVARALCAKQL